VSSQGERALPSALDCLRYPRVYGVKQVAEMMLPESLRHSGASAGAGIGSGVILTFEGVEAFGLMTPSCRFSAMAERASERLMVVNVRVMRERDFTVEMRSGQAGFVGKAAELYL
jgi:hypothetical protein